MQLEVGDTGHPGFLLNSSNIHHSWNFKEKRSIYSGEEQPSQESVLEEKALSLSKRDPWGGREAPLGDTTGSKEADAEGDTLLLACCCIWNANTKGKAHSEGKPASSLWVTARPHHLGALPGTNGSFPAN